MKLPALSGPVLQRRDLLRMEPLLCGQLSRLLPFTAHALYFPQEHIPPEPVWLAQEHRLLLPLMHRGELLGVFIARGCNGRSVRKLLPLLPAFTAQCLDNLEWQLRSRCDALTGLLRREEMLARLCRDAELVRERFSTSMTEENVASSGLHNLCMGLMVIRLQNAGVLLRQHGYSLLDTLLQQLGQTLAGCLSDEIQAARTGEQEFALLIPAAGQYACQKRGEELLQRLHACTLPSALTGQILRPELSLGYALYPQDMDGIPPRLPMYEQARILLQRAELAASVAAERTTISRGRLAPSMSFRHVLVEGGIVRKRLARGRVLLSVGRSVGAHEGLRFRVYAQQDGREGHCKGDVVLVNVGEDAAVGEMLHLEDPADLPAAGDLLRMEEGNSPGKAASGTQRDPETGLLRHSLFRHQLEREYERRNSFVLALLRAQPRQLEETGRMLELDMKAVLEACRQTFQQECLPEALVQGRYSANSMAFCFGGVAVEKLERCFQQLCTELSGKGCLAAVGLAAYPYLDFQKDDMEECCRKALEYALLLPEPRVGVFGSLALNISADRKYSLGDVFGAVEEYKEALLADKHNAMAWNSLGVCMAVLARPREARRYFKIALRQRPGDAATLYNMGTVCQSMGERRSAARYFRECIAADAGHVFAHIRLGQLAEQGGRLPDARRSYMRAMELEDASGSTGSPARRCLARLALRRRRNDDARELLHEALISNPYDAAAMEMLAELYLNSGEDPAMAVMLARQSLALRPRHGATWQLLARALRLLGQEEEACAAEACADGWGQDADRAEQM